MDREKELNQTKELVKDILLKCEDARNSDNYLYSKVSERVNKEVLDMPFGYVLANMEELGLPPFETVRRTRQKTQSEHPELKACDKVESLRSINEEIYKEFARS